jgi:hypothetical protein
MVSLVPLIFLIDKFRQNEGYKKRDFCPDDRDMTDIVDVEPGDWRTLADHVAAAVTCAGVSPITPAEMMQRFASTLCAPLRGCTARGFLPSAKSVQQCHDAFHMLVGELRLDRAGEAAQALRMALVDEIEALLADIETQLGAQPGNRLLPKLVDSTMRSLMSMRRELLMEILFMPARRKFGLV